MVKVYIRSEKSGYYKSRELYTIEVPSAEEAQRIKDDYDNASWEDKGAFVDESYLKANFSIISYKYEEINLDKDASDQNFTLRLGE